MKIKIVVAPIVFLPLLLLPPNSGAQEWARSVLQATPGLKFAPLHGQATPATLRSGQNGSVIPVDLRSDQDDLKRLIKDALPGTVMINVSVTLRGPQSLLSPNTLDFISSLGINLKTDKFIDKEVKEIGSGFIAGEDQYGRALIVTNAHVVDALRSSSKDPKQAAQISVASSNLTVTAADGSNYPATLLGLSDVNRGYDLALVRLNKPCGGCTILKMDDQDDVSAGDIVLAVGSPLGLSHTPTVGIVSDANRVDTNMHISGLVGGYIQTTAPINPGNSGGPLIDISGQVVGINEFIETPNGGSVGLGFAIPIRFARNMLERYRQTGFVDSCDPGLSAMITTAGLVITNVSDDLKSQGLQVGDVIIDVDGSTFGSDIELRRYLADKVPGSQAVFNVHRGALSTQVTVTFSVMQ